MSCYGRLPTVRVGLPLAAGAALRALGCNMDLTLTLMSMLTPGRDGHERHVDGPFCYLSYQRSWLQVAKTRVPGNRVESGHRSGRREWGESGMFWVIVTNELKFLLFMLSLFVVGFHFLHLPKINILLSAFRKGSNEGLWQGR